MRIAHSHNSEEHRRECDARYCPENFTLSNVAITSPVSNSSVAFSQRCSSRSTAPSGSAEWRHEPCTGYGAKDTRIALE